MRILKPEVGYPHFLDTPEDIHILDDPEYCGKYILQGPKVSGTGRVTRMTTPLEEAEVSRLDKNKANSSQVYFIRAGEDGPIKIGHSQNVQSRLRKLQATSPVQLVLLRVEGGGERRERELHARFAKDRLHGEWFYLGKNILEYLHLGVANE